MTAMPEHSGSSTTRPAGRLRGLKIAGNILLCGLALRLPLESVIFDAAGKRSAGAFHHKSTNQNDWRSPPDYWFPSRA